MKSLRIAYYCQQSKFGRTSVNFSRRDNTDPWTESFETMIGKEGNAAYHIFFFLLLFFKPYLFRTKIFSRHHMDKSVFYV